MSVCLSVCLSAICKLAGLTVTPQQGSVVLPGNDTDPSAITILLCYVDEVQTPSPLSLILTTVEWTLPSGSVVTRFDIDERFSIFFDEGLDSQFPGRLASGLLIERLSYADAGVYTCHAEESGMRDSATTELQLQGTILNVIQQ